MPKIIEAIYENGVFKPLERVELKEGEKVKISIFGVVRKTKGILKGSKMEKIIEEIEIEGSF
ncbi:MAG: antitoxin family protein [Archaeoglobaceae archaeon]|nr:antitoxin family protein [Archaeoglobaceae archaeon]